MANEHVAFKTVGWSVGISLALVACAAGPGPSSPNATPSTSDSLPSDPARTPSAECINPAPDLLTLLNQTDPVACYGDSPITVDAQVGQVEVDCAPLVPAWFGCGAWVELQPIAAHAGTTGFVLAATSGSTPPWMFAAIHPETNLIASDIVGRSLRITGHFDDPAAQTCRETQAPFGGATTPPPAGHCQLPTHVRSDRLCQPLACQLSAAIAGSVAREVGTLVQLSTPQSCVAHHAGRHWNQAMVWADGLARHGVHGIVHVS